ncbi:hypothetical protein pb186bvf_005459 [Paramecium bursaria]
MIFLKYLQYVIYRYFLSGVIRKKNFFQQYIYFLNYKILTYSGILMSLVSRKEAKDWTIKLLVIGDSGVGKTNIILRYCENNFHPSHLSTIGIDFKLKTIDVDGTRIKMNIWDTAGQERFKTITQTYYKGAQGIILVYAINDRDSFNNISNWIKQIKNHACENVQMIIIGNKCDLDGRQVTTEEGLTLAKEYKVEFFEASAKDGLNINQSFQTIAKKVKDSFLNVKTPTIESQKLSTNPEKEQQKQGGCC